MEPAGSDIFISYAREDHERARALVDLLDGEGLPVWWDEKILAGSRWDEAIETHLHEAPCVVVLWTRTSVDSEWVRLEASDAKKRNALVPVLLDEVEVPLPFRFVQYVPLTGWDGSLGNPHFGRLVAAIRSMLAAKSAPAVAPGPRPASIAGDATQPRVIDAAIGKELPVGEPATLIAMIRRRDSDGLRAILDVDDEYRLSKDDVASKPFDLEFPVDDRGRLGRADLSLKVSAPQFDPPVQEKKIVVWPDRDSTTYAFLLKPLEEGALTINLEVYEGQECVASRLMRANGLAAARRASRAKRLVSMPVRIVTRPALAYESGPGRVRHDEPTSRTTTASIPSPRIPVAAEASPAPSMADEDAWGDVAATTRLPEPTASCPAPAPAPPARPALRINVLAELAAAAAVILVGSSVVMWNWPAMTQPPAGLKGSPPRPAPDDRASLPAPEPVAVPPTSPAPTAGGEIAEAYASLYEKSLSLLQAGKAAEAIPLLERATSYRPDDSAVWTALGRALLDTAGHATDAQASAMASQAAGAYSRAVELQPGNPDLLADYALAAAQAGELVRARDALDRATRANPPSAPAYLNNYARVLARRGQLDAAAGVIVEVLNRDPNNAKAITLKQSLQKRMATRAARQP